MKYRTIVDLSEPNSSQAIIARQIDALCPRGARVLDLGCAAGDLGAALTEQGFHVTGIDRDAEALAIAKDRMARTLEADLAERSWVGALRDVAPNESFHAICLGDLIDQLTEPATFLREALEFLATEGVVLISVPNVAHGALRLSLLQGQWRYTEEGLLDSTHTRFFTLNSAAELIRSCGLGISEIKATSREVLDTEVLIDDAGLPGSIVEWVRNQDGTSDYQYVFTCSPQTPPNAPLPAVIREAPASRPYDQHAERHRLEAHQNLVSQRREHLFETTAQQRYDTLTTSDKIIGLQAQVALLKKQLNDREIEAIALHDQLVRAHSRLDRTIEGVTYRAVRKTLRRFKKGE